MSATSFNTNSEPRWETYLKTITFALPAVVAWEFACVFLVPKIKVICSDAHFEPLKVGWLREFPFFLVEFGRSIFLALLLVLLLLELFVRGWGRHRRVAVSILVWVLNFAVMLGLTTLLIVVLVAAPGLSHAK